MTRTKSSGGKSPARPKVRKAKAATEAADEPKQTTTRGRRSAARDLDAEEAPATTEPIAAAEPTDVEPIAAYVPPVMAPAPLGLARRRGVFFDVENTSRTEDIEKVLAHLALDFTRGGVEFMAVGNWRVIGHEPARILAAKGAHLIHSAPTTGVRDWSDLRIAVAAGVWIATAQPGDVLEIVSDDQAFEAVGDVAAGRGIVFRRVSYRRLAGLPANAMPIEREPTHGGDNGRRRSRGGRRSRHRGGGRNDYGAPRPVSHQPPPRQVAAHVSNAPADDAVQTAPLDELLDVLHGLLARSPQGISLDMLANALKARGFARRPGSPRLITRLKLIKDIVIDRNGFIRLADGVSGISSDTVRIVHHEDEPHALELEPPGGNEYDDAPGDDLEHEAAAGENASDEAPAEGGAPNGRRRRRRRGGRRRRGRRGGGGGTPVEAAAAPS